MYLLLAPENVFGKIPPKWPLISEEVKFTNNVAYCPKFYWRKWHLAQGCKDISPAWFKKLRKTRQLTNILVIATGGIGDVLWTMPFVKALRKKFPRSKILIATEERTMPVWRGTPYADLCVKDEFWNLQSLIRNAEEVYDFGGVATMFKDQMKKDPIQAIFEVGDLPLPKDRKDLRPQLVVTIDEGKQMQAKLKEEGLDIKKDKIVSIAVASSTPNRDWPFSYTVKLTNLLLEKGYKVIWLGEDKHFEHAYVMKCDCGWESIFKSLTDKLDFTFKCPKCSSDNKVSKEEISAGLLNLCGKTNLRQVMATIALSDLYIGPNSGLMVIATALEIPTIGLFGAFDPALRTKFYDKFQAVWGKVECSPCNEHWTECKYGHPAPCMKVIEPHRILSAAEEMIIKYPRNKIGKEPIE